MFFNPFMPNMNSPFPFIPGSSMIPMNPAFSPMGLPNLPTQIPGEMRKNFLQFQKQNLSEFHKNLSEYLKLVEDTIQSIDKEIIKIDKPEAKK